MKKFILFSFFIFIMSCQIRCELYLVDKIECVVCGPEGNVPLTNSDETVKLDMDGKLIPMSQQIQNEIVSQQIVSEKIPVDPTAADKYVETLKKQNNLKDSDLADLFEKIGRTFAEGIVLLNQQYWHEMFMHYKFKSQQFVTDDVVQEYYNDNPLFTDGKVELQVAYVDFNDSSKDQIKKDLDDFVKNNGNNISIEWSSPMMVALQDIANDKKFILDMNPDQIFVNEGLQTFELYKLISKTEPKMKGLDEVRSTIMDQLTRKKLEKMLEDYNQEIFKSIGIINLGNV